MDTILPYKRKSMQCLRKQEKESTVNGKDLIPLQVPVKVNRKCTSKGIGSLTSSRSTSKNQGILITTTSVYTGFANRIKESTVDQPKMELNVVGTQCSPKSVSTIATDAAISLDGFPANNINGNTTYLCRSEGEFKAQKLNRTEECKLEIYKSRVHREKKLLEKQWSQSAHSFRVKSARVLDRSRPITACLQEIPGGLTRKERPYSSPMFISSFRQRQNDAKFHGVLRYRREKTCITCQCMRDVVQLYDDHIHGSDSDDGDDDADDHGRYMFSDTQVKTFMNLLETEYCYDFPDMRDIMHNDGLVDRYTTRINSGGLWNSGIQNRINRFCRSQDSFNKKHPLPTNIKDGLESVRIAQAILSKRQHLNSRKAKIIREAKRKLGILKN